MLELHENIMAIDKCIYLPDIKALILADLHFGFEEHLGKGGVLVPRFHFRDVLKSLNWIFSKVEVKQIILNGDIKHEFGRISQQEWCELTRFVNFLKEKNIKITAVKGNHDTIFGPLARKLGIKEVEELKHKNILIAHGDYVPKKLLPILIIGHEHPAITLRDNSKAEKFKCFVKCPFRNSTIICLPALNPLTIGTDILKEKLLSLLLKNVKNAEVFIIDDKTHDVLVFGKIREFLNY